MMCLSEDVPLGLCRNVGSGPSQAKRSPYQPSLASQPGANRFCLEHGLILFLSPPTCLVQQYFCLFIRSCLEQLLRASNWRMLWPFAVPSCVLVFLETPHKVFSGVLCLVTACVLPAFSLGARFHLRFLCVLFVLFTRRGRSCSELAKTAHAPTYFSRSTGTSMRICSVLFSLSVPYF